jgi:hypothetical protein
MAGHIATADHGPSRSLWELPQSALGWWAIALTVLIFPVAWALMTHAIPLDTLDTWVSPVILVGLIDAAAATGVVAAWRRRERSIVLVAALIVAVPLALFGTLMLALEVAFPH